MSLFRLEAVPNHLAALRESVSRDIADVPRIAQRVEERSRTRIVPVAARLLNGDDTVEITVRNDGNEKLADFARWDVVLQYDAATGGLARWYPYVEAVEPGSNQWTVAGLYLDAANAIPEALEPGILNPGEEMVIRVRISPPASDGTTCIGTVATPNGMSTTMAFSR